MFTKILIILVVIDSCFLTTKIKKTQIRQLRESKIGSPRFIESQMSRRQRLRKKFLGTSGLIFGGREPEKIDHMLCKVQMFIKWDEIMINHDANAVAEAYYNKKGFPCVTYCRIRTSAFEFKGLKEEYPSPYYTDCGAGRYCAKDGVCAEISKRLILPGYNEGQKSAGKADEAKIDKIDKLD